MRVLFFLIFLIGLAAGFGYPWAVRNVGGHDLGTWHVYDAVKGYQPAEVALKSGDAPVNVEIEMTTQGTPNLQGSGAVLTLVADSGGRTVLAQPLTFATSKPRDTNPQLQEKIYRDSAGVIDTVEDASYRFTVGPGDAEGVTVKSAELILRSQTMAVDSRVQPIGFALTAIGFIGFVLALTRRGGGTPSNPNSQPPPKRWGRDAAS
ncbi:hypothetical protein SAMN04488498_11756 [Mesorhizobium albiziae]|uniref:Uncharacterized protein n=1 Tax=Neomesorhizobium albiziae TaxID=335020 RepID=A0A1I4DFY3_9HYPH|nr:hypothetical protein [Mesorhizobium albiziae]GLS32377.1 hypothetical protein GCM10007937_40870 [Mesorhizobium albiziae]SFK91799.1 hypothetical protein SAMN04488498_11756 [Mesorhizobium albiziae]